MSFLSRSANDTETFGHRLAKSLKPGGIVAFYGDLGAGKTTLVKGVINELTSVESQKINSPTFTYLNIYGDVYHFDLYRLKDHHEFIKMGFLDYLEGEGIVLIEWPTRILPLLPKDTTHVRLSYEGKDQRMIDVHKG